ncbi:MAG: hypothetical protein R3182_14020, partial [Draconibacterium sp.]|nr:hypothetical protein [Draconibacterium sp.]
MKYLIQLLSGLLFLITICEISAYAQSESSEKFPYQLENPMSLTFLKKNLKKQTPRLVLNKKIEKELKQKLKTDSIVQSFYEILEDDAYDILELPLIKRTMVGRRMGTLDTRERLTTLAMVYRINGDKKLLDRINSEILAVSNFTDWNPSHFLDVAGTALPLALAIDWVGNDLPNETVITAKQALINKGLLPSFDMDGLIEDEESGRHNENFNWWIDCHHNWNQVCHAGMIGAAIAVADVDPELASKTISRALENMGLALAAYGPDGVYPEGASYWGFGTMHTLMSISMFESAFGTDFGISGFPGFMKSADFISLSTAPTSEFYNFYDCGTNATQDNRGFGNADVAMFNRSTLAANLLWFASKTGNSFYFDESYFTDQSDTRRKQYFDGPALVWLAQYNSLNENRPPNVWKGEGSNHLAIFKSNPDEKEMFYLGAKG